MTGDEAFGQLYFGVRLFVDDSIVVDCNQGDPGRLNYYNLIDGHAVVAPTNVNEHSPFSFARQVGGRTVTLVVDGSYQTGQGGVVLQRACTVTADERYRVWFSSKLGQLMTRDSQGNYAIEDTTESASHLVPVQPPGASLTYDVRQELDQLWTALQNPDKLTFGGIVEVHVEFFKHLILRDPAQGDAILRSSSNLGNIIQRDA